MSWDPITRIVGSLGIYTKIDFANRQVAECHSTSSIFRGYSIFMKGKDPRDAHFITSRICGICGDNHATCAVYAQNMAFGVQPPALAEWIVNLGEAAEYMFDHNIFQDNLVGVDFCEQMVKETNPERAGTRRRRRRRRTPTDHGYRTIADIMRALNPFTGEFYREALQMSRHDARDVLPDGRPARPSLDALSRRRRHRAHRAALHRLPGAADEVRRVHEEGACRCTTTCSTSSTRRCPATRRSASGACCWAAGARSTIPTACDYTYKNMNDWGRAMYVTPGVVVDGKTGHQRPGRHQPRHPHPAGQLVLRRLGRRRARCSSRTIRSAIPVDPRHPWNQTTHAPAAEARLRRQVHLGHVAALVRQAHRRSSGAGHRRRPDRPALGDGAGRDWSTSATSRRPATASRSTCPRRRRSRRSSSSGRSRSGATPSSATGPAPTSRPTPRRARSTSSSRR